MTQVADEIPKTLDEFKAAGVNPAYMIGGDVPQRGVKSLRQQDTQLPRIGRETSSRQAKRMHVDYDMANQARLEALKARRLMANQTAMEFLRKYGQDPVAVLGDEARGMTGRELAEAMRERGFIAYNPRSIFNIVNDAEVKIHDDFIVKDSLVRGDTQFLAKNLYDTMAYTLSTKPMHWATQGLLSANQRWKNALLPLSPTWYTGNIFGNAMMAMIGSGIDPVTYTQLMVEGIRQLRRDGVRIRDAVRGGEMPSTAPRRLRTAGLTYAESGALSPDFALRKQGRTRLGRGYRRFSEAAYGANEFFDNLNKNAVYLHELARAEGNPQLMARLETDGLGPDEYAIREALRVMGDFSRMAPWERKAVAVMPFYRWARHITQLTVRLPIEHPMRVAWTLKIPDLFGEDQSDWPAWLQGSVSMGNWVLPARYLNPFGDVAGAEGPLGVGGALLDPDSFARSLSPFIKYPVGAFTGLDLGSGIGDDLSMPTDRRRIDPNTGRPTTTPLIDLSGGGINVGGLANLAVNQLPVARNIRDLVFGDVPRYDTGERIESLRPRQPFFQGPARLTQLVGIPEPIHVDDLDEQRARLRSAARRRG